MSPDTRMALQYEVDTLREIVSEHQSMNSGKVINQIFLRILTLIEYILED